MKIKNYKKIKNSQYEITLEDNSKVCLHEDLILEANLLIKKSISDTELEELKKKNEKFELYTKSLKFLATKMRCSKEIYDKFKEYDKENIKFVINRLYNEGYLNDLVYIKAFINDQINLKLNGPKKIISELKKLGFKEEDVSEEISLIEDEVWNEKVNKLITKAIKSNRNKSNAFLAKKITNDLLNKGYYGEMISNKLNSVEFNDDTDIINKLINQYYKKYSEKYNDEELKYQITSKLIVKGHDKSKVNELYEIFISQL